MVEADAGADVNEGQVVVQRVLANGCEHPPGSDRTGDQQKPGEGGEAEVAENAVVDPPQYEVGYPRSASGTGFRGSGPMYSD